jgi:hypothetical protein
MFRPALGPTLTPGDGAWRGAAAIRAMASASYSHGTELTMTGLHDGAVTATGMARTPDAPVQIGSTTPAAAAV